MQVKYPAKCLKYVFSWSIAMVETRCFPYFIWKTNRSFSLVSHRIAVHLKCQLKLAIVFFLSKINCF